MVFLTYNGGTVAQITQWLISGTYVDPTCLYIQSSKLYTPQINTVGATLN